MMSWPADPGSYCYGRKLLERVGWEMYLGGNGIGGERWEPITRVRIRGDQVLLTVAGGTTYRAGYSDAVRCRRPPAGPLCPVTAIFFRSVEAARQAGADRGNPIKI